MSLETFMQTLMYGVFAGGIYGVAAMGLALVFGVLKLLNIAHGELVMIGGYVGFWAFTALGLDPFVSLIIVVPALFLLGLLLERTVYRTITRLTGEERIKNSLLVSFGLTLVLQNLVQWAFTGDERSIQVSYAGDGFNIYGVLLPYTRVATLVIVLAVTLGLHYFLHKTYPGKAILATAEDYESAELAGININRVYMLTFALGAALAGVAGELVTLTYSLSPSIGMVWTLKALIVIVLAGTGSILGALPAGILLGVVEALSGVFIASTYREVVGLVIFLVVLLLRPQGLFSRE
jgi:Branched-chain amino acid ABC-type transport system, permease components